MQGFFQFLQTLIICLSVLAALFLILLALPGSKLRSLLLEILGWTGTAVSAVGLVSPIDVVPDVIPVAGWLDDLGYLVVGIICAVVAYFQRKKRKAHEALPYGRR